MHNYIISRSIFYLSLQEAITYSDYVRFHSRVRLIGSLERAGIDLSFDTHIVLIHFCM